LAIFFAYIFEYFEYLSSVRKDNQVRPFSFWCCICIVFHVYVNGQIKNDIQNETDYYRFVVETLAHDSMKGRAVASPEEKKAARFIVSELNKNPLAVIKFQKFKFQQNDSTGYQNSYNVYTYINNKADSTIIIGAHYDHIGQGSHLSFALSKRNEIHNGADDNASGISLLLGLYKDRHTWQTKKYNYVFVAYSAHEVGLFGSTSFSKLVNKRFKNVALLINFDMVGRLDTAYPVIEVVRSNELSTHAKKYFDIDKIQDIHVRSNNGDKIYNTDARAFIKQNISAISISTGIHNDYHKPSDDATEINYDGILKIQKVLQDFLRTYP
jgi:hypothetical protein